MNSEPNPDVGRLLTYEGEWMLRCPACDETYTHVEQAYAMEGYDPEEGGSECGELYGVPVGGKANYRRGCLVIQVWGECGHRFRIELQQHKGQTFVSAVMEASRESDFG
ncbi:MAG TPA: hypothetical protein VKD65_15560 [Candidatus Angelobacter sp.]|nr:hypothetical protein [Candidatus Angelobacter sp.]